MAYETKYQIDFSSDLVQPVSILIKKKDGQPGDIIKYAAESCQMQYSGKDGKLNNIAALSVTVGFNLRVKAVIEGETIWEDDPDYWPDFQDMEQDTWMMEILFQNQYTIFKGFVLPDIGKRPFEDGPCSVTLTAVDQLGLTKDTPLVNTDGSEFRGEHTMLEYLVAALQLTGLKLPVRIYDNVFNKGMLNRDDDPKWDMWSQTKLDYRTFMKDAVTFVSAREALEILVGDTHLLYQWNGEWVVFRLSQWQYWPFVKYYTSYDENGQNAVGHEITEDYALIGKSQMISPVEPVDKSLNSAVRYAKSIYNYTVWPEIPKNNKFDLGELIGSGTAHKGDLLYDLRPDYDNDVVGTYENFSIKDWEYGTKPATTTGKMNVVTNGQIAYRKVIKDDYGNIIDDHLVLDSEPVISVLHSSGVPVKAGDKVSFSVGFSPNNDFAQPSDQSVRYTVARIYLVGDDGSTFGLDSEGKWYENERGDVAIDYSVFDDTRPVRNVSFQSRPAPRSGTLYIALEADPIAGGFVYYKDFSFSLISFAGTAQLKGDYWLYGQYRNLPDVLETTAQLSDTDHKIFKGCLLNTDGVPYRPQWYRMGIDENKHYRQLGTISLYNMQYRRMLKLDGAFTGITFAYNNKLTEGLPIALHVLYRLVDVAYEVYCVLTSPLTIDLYNGQISGTAEEVYQTAAPGVSAAEPVSQLVSRIKAAIDNTTAAEWDSEGEAPATGTQGFPPFTGDILNPKPNKFSVAMPVGSTMDVSATGDTSVQKVEGVFLGVNVVTFFINKYFVGDTITFTAWGHEVSITVQAVTTAPVDGQETGDYHDFKFLFS